LIDILKSYSRLIISPQDAKAILAAVTVWTRDHDGTTSYRISDEDLASEGYRRGSTDRQDIVTMLARSPGSCTLGPCTLQLSTNSRESDGAISHQENVLGTPEGFKDLDDSFYCARRFGDCGAQLPVFRFTKGSGSSMGASRSHQSLLYALSLFCSSSCSSSSLLVFFFLLTSTKRFFLIFLSYILFLLLEQYFSVVLLSGFQYCPFLAHASFT
ncbi:hypothetical protein ANCCAN_06278, partial [Ancylostoma caninum]